VGSDPLFGVALHALGGLAAASFYLPFRRVRGWAWESSWLVSGLLSWIVTPLLLAAAVVPGFAAILRSAPRGSLLGCYAFGVLWGIGGLTFGLSMRFLGMSLGYALAIGCCAVFGTLVPPLCEQLFTSSAALIQLATTESGLVTLAGVAVCLAGIATCGWAGMRKERELPDEAKRAAIVEFDFAKGLRVALFAGVMSACMAFAISAGKPIAALAVQRGVPPLWQNAPVFVVILCGGFTTNLVWCAVLNLRHGSLGDYRSGRNGSLLLNYLWSALAGVIWYLQFMFYGMGTTQMGRYDFSSWTIHMAFIIVFSNIWGLFLHEWRAASTRTIRLVLIGIAILVASTFVIGGGNYLASLRE